jgi:hypothetical protein
MYRGAHLLCRFDAKHLNAEWVEEIHIGRHHSHIGTSGRSRAREGPALATT